MSPCGEFCAPHFASAWLLVEKIVPYKGGLQANISECVEERRDGMKYVSIIR